MLYDRPVRELLRDAAKELPSPTTTNDIISWFAHKYPLVKRTTVAAHITGLTANDRNRHHYSVSRYDPIFTRTSGGSLGLYDADIHLEDEETIIDDDAIDDLRDPEDEPAVNSAAAEFVLEAHLEEFLLGNWTAVNWGRPLHIWQSADGTSGHQLSTPVGRLDLLCIDTTTNDLVVVELKRGHSADRVVGQVARYMGWVRTHLAAAGQGVEGIVVAREHDDRLRYAAAALPGLTIFNYTVTFELQPVPELTR
jgi:endonuclease